MTNAYIDILHTVVKYSCVWHASTYVCTYVPDGTRVPWGPVPLGSPGCPVKVGADVEIAENDKTRQGDPKQKAMEGFHCFLPKSKFNLDISSTYQHKCT